MKDLSCKANTGTWSWSWPSMLCSSLFHVPGMASGFPRIEMKGNNASLLLPSVQLLIEILYQTMSLFSFSLKMFHSISLR